MSQFIENKNFGKTFADLNMDTSLDYAYHHSININIKRFKKLKYGIDSINFYSNKGLYYLNPLILAISRLELDNVLYLLQNGSAPRGYLKYPGYPLYKTIELLQHELINPDLDKNKKIINIMELLVKYGARFNDYVVHIFWSKFISVLEKIDKENKNRILLLYAKTPFSYKQYQIYLDILCEECITKNGKDKMLESFSKHFPQEHKSKFSLKLFFLH